MMMLRIIILNI